MQIKCAIFQNVDDSRMGYRSIHCLKCLSYQYLSGIGTVDGDGVDQ